VPTGDYLIGSGIDKDGHSGDNHWYPLYGRDGNGGYSKSKIPVSDPVTGQSVIRGLMYLHTGRRSDGCVTVWSDVGDESPDYPHSAAYDKMKAMLDSTSTFDYKPGDSYIGHLYVK
jgi:hypothetical protein